MDFLKGTYGFDLLSIVIILLSFILNVFDITRILGLLILIYAIYRAFSKKIYKRKEEYNVFYTYTNKLLTKFGNSIPYNLHNYDLNNFGILFNNIKHKFNEFRNYKITTCPNCKLIFRLPRNKGNIVVTCKRCSTKFDFRT